MKKNLSQVTATENQPAEGTTFLVCKSRMHNTMRCYKRIFNYLTTEDENVNNLEDVRLGLLPYSEEEYYNLKRKRAVFFFQERFGKFPGYDWNGFILVGLKGQTDMAQKVVKESHKELNIVLSYADPYRDLYFMLIDTKTGGGTYEEFTQWRKHITENVMQPLFSNPRTFHLGFYQNAVTIDHYDIVDYDTLFPECSKAAVQG